MKIRLPLQMSRSERKKRIARSPSGFVSAVRTFALAPFGRRGMTYTRRMDHTSRDLSGLTLILPGIEGGSVINDGIAYGLYRAGLPHAVRIRDWRRSSPWNPLHLARLGHNRAVAAEIAEEIVRYRELHPNGFVHLVGHSAGAGMALFVLECLPDNCRVTSVALLAAAVSRSYPVHAVLPQTTGGIWNFSSVGDLPTVGMGTLIFGTMDRRHAVSAGALGFRRQGAIPSDAAESGPRTDASTGSNPEIPLLHEVPFRPGMLRWWNLGGHFGATNAAFAANYLAPVLLEAERRSGHLPAGNVTKG